MSNEHNNAAPVSKFIEQANALLRLDDVNALVPHGIGGFARELLTEAIRLLSESTAPTVPQDEPFGYFRVDALGWTDCAATDEGAIALYERPAAPAVPNVLKRGYGRLIQAAADLALQQFMPSDIVDDYPSKTISAAKVAKMMTQPRDRLRLLSIEVSEGAKQMIAAAPAAPSQETAVPQGWKLVPIEPTPEMGRAYLEAAKIHAAEGAEDKMRFSPGGYAAMLSAAPSQPVTLTNGLIEKGAMTGMVDAQIDAIITALREKGKA